MSATDRWPDVCGIPVDSTDGLPSLDLRSLEPPQPAVTILTFLARPDCGDAVLVRLAREPVFLYPELVEIGWSWVPRNVVPGDVHLLLTRDPQDPKKQP